MSVILIIKTMSAVALSVGIHDSCFLTATNCVCHKDSNDKNTDKGEAGQEVYPKFVFQFLESVG